MILKFTTNYGPELIHVRLDDEMNVVSTEVRDPIMCEFAFQNCGIPCNTASLKRFFHKNMGREDEIADYVSHIREHGFYNPYVRNLRISIID